MRVKKLMRKREHPLLITIHQIHPQENHKTLPPLRQDLEPAQVIYFINSGLAKNKHSFSMSQSMHPARALPHCQNSKVCLEHGQFHDKQSRHRIFAWDHIDYGHQKSGVGASTFSSPTKPGSEKTSIPS